MRHARPQTGFTLVETLIYLGIVGLVAVAIVQFILLIRTTGEKSYIIQEVNGIARSAMQEIQDGIRGASGLSVASSTFGSDPGALWLITPVTSTNPTIIQLTENDGVLRITYGTSSPTTITTNAVKVTDLQFQRVSNSSSSETIQVRMTVSAAATDDVTLTYSTTITSTITTRN